MRNCSLFAVQNALIIIANLQLRLQLARHTGERLTY